MSSPAVAEFLKPNFVSVLPGLPQKANAGMASKDCAEANGSAGCGSCELRAAMSVRHESCSTSGIIWRHTACVLVKCIFIQKMVVLQRSIQS